MCQNVNSLQPIHHYVLLYHREIEIYVASHLGTDRIKIQVRVSFHCSKLFENIEMEISIELKSDSQANNDLVPSHLVLKVK